MGACEVFFKSLYGLKQSLRAWYSKLSRKLTMEDFKTSSVDNTLFIKRKNNITTIIVVYINDIIITGNNLQDIQNVKLILKTL